MSLFHPGFLSAAANKAFWMVLKTFFLLIFGEATQDDIRRISNFYWLTLLATTVHHVPKYVFVVHEFPVRVRSCNAFNLPITLSSLFCSFCMSSVFSRADTLRDKLEAKTLNFYLKRQLQHQLSFVVILYDASVNIIFGCNLIRKETKWTPQDNGWDRKALAFDWNRKSFGDGCPWHRLHSDLILGTKNRWDKESKSVLPWRPPKKMRLGYPQNSWLFNVWAVIWNENYYNLIAFIKHSWTQPERSVDWKILKWIRYSQNNERGKFFSIWRNVMKVEK